MLCSSRPWPAHGRTQHVLRLLRFPQFIIRRAVEGARAVCLARIRAGPPALGARESLLLDAEQEESLEAQRLASVSALPLRGEAGGGGEGGGQDRPLSTCTRVFTCTHMHTHRHTPGSEQRQVRPSPALPRTRDHRCTVEFAQPTARGAFRPSKSQMGRALCHHGEGGAPLCLHSDQGLRFLA